MTLKQGQIITKLTGEKIKVIEALTNAVLVSWENYHDKVGNWFTESELRDLGYTWKEEKWTPHERQVYWYIHHKGFVDNTTWSSLHDGGISDFLGVYPTEEAAQTALADIKRKLSL